MKISEKTRKALNRLDMRIITEEETVHGQNMFIDLAIPKEIRFYGDSTDLDVLIDFIYACDND